MFSMTCMKRMAVMTLLVVMSGNMHQVAAAGDEARRATPREPSTGTIDSINTSSQIVVIGDKEFRLSPNLRVRAADQRPIPASELREGSKVLFLFDRHENGRVVTDIWLDLR